MVNAQGLTNDELRQRFWDVAAPQEQAQQAAWSDAYATAAARRRGSEVHVLPAARMPCRTVVAASFRH